MLHDGVQQHLALMGLRLSLLQRRIGTDPAAAIEICTELREELGVALDELRSVAHLIYPAILENEGLGAAIENAATRLRVHAVIDVTDTDIPSDVRQAFYFCCLEALDNAGHHGGEGVTVAVKAGADDGTAWFEVVDDGHGFARGTRPEAGLQHVKDRVEALEGRFELSSTPHGTRVAGVVPLAG